MRADDKRQQVFFAAAVVVEVQAVAQKGDGFIVGAVEGVEVFAVFTAHQLFQAEDGAQGFAADFLRAADFDLFSVDACRLFVNDKGGMAAGQAERVHDETVAEAHIGLAADKAAGLARRDVGKEGCVLQKHGRFDAFAFFHGAEFSDGLSTVRAGQGGEALAELGRQAAGSACGVVEGGHVALGGGNGQSVARADEGGVETEACGGGFGDADVGAQFVAVEGLVVVLHDGGGHDEAAAADVGFTQAD